MLAPLIASNFAFARVLAQSKTDVQLYGGSRFYLGAFLTKWRYLFRYMSL